MPSQRGQAAPTSSHPHSASPTGAGTGTASPVGRGIPPADRLWAAGLRARHGDLIARYTRRRVPQPLAQQITNAVFAHAAARRHQVPEPALPWLIATARSHCAAAHQARHRPPRATQRNTG